jgi:hypothetical protein
VWLSFSSTLSVMACPDRLVPAARNVTGTPCLRAMGRMRRISASLWTWRVWGFRGRFWEVLRNVGEVSRGFQKG